ncbi:MAG: DivIVA domain-containing protein [Thermoanaerobaculia bacterium]|nr:MAG: DivIVA domain-containing protein [Thermoanaerobaculia bacterium]MBZ0103957.1 DivIVA domain-containing protein [Thermoanaerobaculia bacterium]
MPMQPLEIQKQRFAVRLRGYDPNEVENFLTLVAEELSQRLGDIERLDRENRLLRERLETAESRERDLQETLLRGKKVSDEMISTSQREAQLLVKEAEMHGEKLVNQAMERAQEIDNRIQELRTRRRELQLKLRGTLELFGQILQADMEEEHSSANIQTIGRRRSG